MIDTETFSSGTFRVVCANDIDEYINQGWTIIGQACSEFEAHWISAYWMRHPLEVSDEN